MGAEWRARWKASKETGTPLFPKTVSEWNPSQVALAYWFNFYDTIYEHHERPPARVIENDDLLDKWVMDKTKEAESRAKKNSNVNSSRKAMDYDEVIVFDDADDEYYDDDDFIDGDEVDKKFGGVDYD